VKKESKIRITCASHPVKEELKILHELRISVKKEPKILHELRISVQKKPKILHREDGGILSFRNIISPLQLS
jgi:hypothetical protein